MQFHRRKLRGRDTWQFPGPISQSPEGLERSPPLPASQSWREWTTESGSYAVLNVNIPCPMSEPKRANGSTQVLLDSSLPPQCVCKILYRLDIAGKSYVTVNAGGLLGPYLRPLWSQQAVQDEVQCGPCPCKCLETLVRFSALVHKLRVSEGKKKPKNQMPSGSQRIMAGGGQHRPSL